MGRAGSGPGRKPPTIVPTGAIREIATDSGESCAVFERGYIKCWGSAYALALGIDFTGMVLPSFGDEPAEMGDNLPVVDLGGGREASAVAVSSGRVCAIVDDGAVRCWGYNAGGYLGIGSKEPFIGDAPGEAGENVPTVDLGNNSRVTAIALGPNHACALLDDGSVKCWGFNGAGQLGLGDEETRGDAPGEMGDALPTVDLGSGRTAKAIAAGNSFSCAVLDDDSLKCWGDNMYWAKLGLGDKETRGDEPGEMGDNLPAVNLGRGKRVKSVALGDQFACALLTDGTVKCWGQRVHLGLGRLTQLFTNEKSEVIGNEPDEMGDMLPAVDLGEGRTALAISATGGVEVAHTCVLLDDGSVKCWGFSKHGELGLGDTEFRGDDDDEIGAALPAIDLGKGRTAVAIATGANHSCALLDNDSLKCWGQGGGALGLGDREARGDEPGEMGDNLPAVDLGTR